MVHNYSVFLCNDFYFSKFGSTVTPYISGSSTWSLSLSLSPWAIWLKVCQIYWYFEESSLASFIFPIVFSFLLQFFPLYSYFFLSTCFRFTLLFFSQCLIWNLRALIWDFWFLLFICLYCYKFPSVALAVPHNFLYVMPSLFIDFIFITIKVFPNFPCDFFFLPICYLGVCCIISTYFWVSPNFFCYCFLISLNYGEHALYYLYSYKFNEVGFMA